jgi:ABC-type multidrug transport system fused ATPase/permease subunit
MKNAVLVFVTCLIVFGASCSMFQHATPVTAVPTVDQIATAVTQPAAKGTNFFVPLSILGVVGGVVLLFLGMTKIGIATVIGCLVGAAVSMALTRYAHLIAAGGAIAAAAAVVWAFVMKYKSLATALATKTQAVVELVKGVQKVKSVLLPSKSNINEAMASEQSESTKEIVAEVKSSSATS